MIADLMLRGLLSAGLVALAAACMDGVARQFGCQRRWIWAAALAASLALPLAGPWIPAPGLVGDLGFGGSAASVTLELPAAAAGPDMLAIASDTPWPAPRELLNSFLLLLWVLTSAGLLAVLLGTGWRLRAARLSGTRARMSGVPVVLAEAVGPAVVGVLRPSVLLPVWVAELPPHDRRLIAAHEWEHVRARDTVLLAGAAAVLVLAPWNPVLWWQHRRLREAIETDCDARLLGRGVDRHAYGLVLLHTAGRARTFPLLSPSLAHTRSTLERRILAMTYRTPKHRLARSGGLLGLAALGIVAACDFASNRPSAGPTDPVVPELSLTEAEDEAPTTVEPGTYTLLEASEPGELLVVEGVDKGDESTGFRISRVQGASGEARTALLRTPRVALSGEGEPIYFVDGVRVEALELERSDVHRIEVVKGAAAREIWGEEATNGAVRIVTRAAAGATAEGGPAIRAVPIGTGGEAPRVRFRATAAGMEPIYLVDGVRVDRPDIDALDVHRVEVLKGEAARAVVREAGAAGVVRITTKEAAASERIEEVQEQLEIRGGAPGGG